MSNALIALDFVNDIVHPDRPMASAADHDPWVGQRAKIAGGVTSDRR